MVGFADSEDRPKKLEMSGYVHNKTYAAEWVVWRRSQVMAEFTVFHKAPSHSKPTIRGTGAGLTPHRALLAAAAEALDMGADREAVLFGLSSALGVAPGATAGKEIPRLVYAVQGRGSKLKSEGPQPWKRKARIA